MTETKIPDYTLYGPIALAIHIAHRMEDVKEGKNTPHARRMLELAMLELITRVTRLQRPVLRLVDNDA